MSRTKLVTEQESNKTASILKAGERIQQEFNSDVVAVKVGEQIISNGLKDIKLSLYKQIEKVTLAYNPNVVIDALPESFKLYAMNRIKTEQKSKTAKAYRESNQ
jgi:hypothetical protein